MNAHIMVVDDDEQVLETISLVLEDEGYAVSTAESGIKALNQMRDEKPDVIILDIMMPGMDGLEVCRTIRADPFFAKLPVIFLTAKNRPNDIAAGLDLGADDYLVKPFDIIELSARIRAVLRRSGYEGDDETIGEVLSYGRLELPLTRLEVHIDEHIIQLTAIEHHLLHCLLMNQGTPMSAERLLEDVWNYPHGVGDPQLVRVHIANLRNKLDFEASDQEYIQNARGRGYFFGL